MDLQKVLTIVNGLANISDLRDASESDGQTVNPLIASQDVHGSKLAALITDYNEEQVVLDRLQCALIEKYAELGERLDMMYANSQYERLQEAGHALNSGSFQYDAYRLSHKAKKEKNTPKKW